MLIKALSDYYDILKDEGKILSDYYSNVKIHYIVCLTEDGKIDNIIDAGKDCLEVMPRREDTTKTLSNKIEHRGKYIFGFDWGKNQLLITDNSKKSYENFKKVNIEFLENLDSPIINAYRNFILNWNPENEIENQYLINLGTKYNNPSFVFCLSGQINLYLHKDKQVIKKYKNLFDNKKENDIKSQCAITGELREIARIHDKIKGISKGQSSGTLLVSFNNESENSYCNEQSYNSNISKYIMKKYTTALNYILSNDNNKSIFDDITVIYWVMSNNEKSNDIISDFLFNESNDYDIKVMLENIIKEAKSGLLTHKKIKNILSELDLNGNDDFYMVGLKPNSSRLALKFIYKRKFADILINIGIHQNDMQISNNIKPISLWKIKNELVSPKAKKKDINPALFDKIFKSIIYGTNYPKALLYIVIQRAKIDKNTEKNQYIDIKNNTTRVGIIKAYINRKCRISNKEEEIKLGLDKENKNSAYLCGRLFAVLEKLQQRASGDKLNTTIRDTYFASASSKPAIIFPKIINLAQNHIKKLDNPKFYNDLIREIINDIDNEFPKILTLEEQGRFIIGYYQQYQSFFEKKSENEHLNKEEE